MARYREKDEVDLAWNHVRRQLTRELDTHIAKWREQALNRLLSDAWHKFSASLEQGEKPQLESAYENFVAVALDDVIGRVVE